MERRDPKVWNEQFYCEEGIITPLIPFKVYDTRFMNERYENFKHLKGEIADIGCGKKPFPWANILVDFDPFGRRGYEYNKGVPGLKYRKKDSDRKLYVLEDGRRLFQIDIIREPLPFKDKSLDYVYTNQTVEHLDNPSFALKEMMRTGKEGLVRFPGIGYELLYGNGVSPESEHKWMIEIIDGALVFRRMTREEKELIELRKKDFNEEKYPGYFPEEFVERYLDVLKDVSRRKNELFWKDRFEFKIV